MEPIPETRETIEQLVAHGETAVEATLLRMGRRANSIVPECVGLTLALLDDGLTLTLAATSEVLAGLDAVQYVVGRKSVSLGRPTPHPPVTNTWREANRVRRLDPVAHALLPSIGAIAYVTNRSCPSPSPGAVVR